MKLRPVISATAFTTASMSALTKLRVTMSSAAWPTTAASAAARNKTASNRGIDVVKGGRGSRTLDARRYPRFTEGRRLKAMIAWAFQSSADPGDAESGLRLHLI
jgi:hypothetical protein